MAFCPLRVCKPIYTVCVCVCVCVFVCVCVCGGGGGGEAAKGLTLTLVAIADHFINRDFEPALFSKIMHVSVRAALCEVKVGEITVELQRHVIVRSGRFASRAGVAYQCRVGLAHTQFV